jgi:hypothetical protein
MIDFESWYSITVPRYEQLAQRVKPIIETALTSENIIYSDIQLRIKDFESVKEKIMRKKYSGPDNVEDLLGCRIICYILSDIERISNIIQENFYIHNLEDKSRKLGISSEREPLVDVSKTDKEIKIVVEMPGVNKEDIKIDAYNSTLEVATQEGASKKYHETIELPEEADLATSKSKYNI